MFYCIFGRHLTINIEKTRYKLYFDLSMFIGKVSSYTNEIDMILIIAFS